MKLFEYQGKKFFKKYGIPTPRGIFVRSIDDLIKAFQAVKGKRGAVLKAQVLTGGRKKAGGIIIAETEDECRSAFEEIRNQNISGHIVDGVLVEERIPIEKEFYLGLTIETEIGQPVLLISSKGGIDVEQLAIRFPKNFMKNNVDVAYGLFDYQVRYLLSMLKFHKSLFSSFIDITRSLYKFFMDFDAVLAEINPLVLDENGKLNAVDARVNIDDAALYRQPEINALKEERKKTLEEQLRDEFQLEYVELDGNIGLISGGAGMTMTAMDLIAAKGGKPACFMDCSANVSPKGYEEALKTVSSRKGVSSILINIFGGLTRMDLVGQYLVEAIENIGGIKQPLTIRLQGTEAEKGKAFMQSAGFSTVEVFEEAVTKAVESGGK